MRILPIEYCIHCRHWIFDIEDGMWIYTCQETGSEIYREVDDDDHGMFTVFAEQSIPIDCPLEESII